MIYIAGQIFDEVCFDEVCSFLTFSSLHRFSFRFKQKLKNWELKNINTTSSHRKHVGKTKLKYSQPTLV